MRTMQLEEDRSPSGRFNVDDLRGWKSTRGAVCGCRIAPSRLPEVHE